MMDSWDVIIIVCLLIVCCNYIDEGLLSFSPLGRHNLCWCTDV